MNVRAHMLIPPHYLVSTAFKKMRWKDEFSKKLLFYNIVFLFVCPIQSSTVNSNNKISDNCV